MSSVDKIAVVYARYSSHGQTEQSIEGQIAAAQKYAEQHGYTIIHIYADRAMTGRNDDREEFQRMLSDTATHQFGVILLWKIDRFGRNREEIAFNRYRCKKNGVRVERVAEDVPDGPEGVILDSVLEGMAEYYSLQLAQNVRRGQRESAKKSQTVGGCKIIGYNVNPDTKRYEVDPKTAPFVTEVFKRYANGETISEIVAWLNAQGVRTTRGGEFTVNSLHRLLKNEKYTGVYIFHDIRNEGGMPALIDHATFDKVQEMLKVNRRAPARVWSKTEYLLTDKLFCGHCGAMMVGESGHGRNGTKHNYYTCWNRKKKKSCDKKPVRQDVIESLVLRSIGKLLENPATLENIADQVWAAYERSDTSGDTIKALDKQIADVNKALSNVMKAIEMGIINEMTKTRMDELTDQKQALSAARAEAGLAGGFKLTRDMILFFLQEIAALDMADRDSQKRLIKTFVNAIYLYDDHFDIAFNYTDNGKVVVRMQEINDAACGEVFGRCAQSPATYARNRDFAFRIDRCRIHGLAQVTEKVISFMLMAFRYCIRKKPPEVWHVPGLRGLSLFIYFSSSGTFSGTAAICAIRSALAVPSFTVRPMSMASCSRSSVVISSSWVASRWPTGEPSAFLLTFTVNVSALFSTAFLPAASMLISHSGTGAPIWAAFSAMLPSSVKMYQHSTTGSTRVGIVNVTPGMLFTSTCSTVSATAATTTTTIMPALCHTPSLAVLLDQLPVAVAAAVPLIQSAAMQATHTAHRTPT